MAQKVRAELKGRKFGRLKVVQYVGNNRHKKALWLCECDCGGSTIAIGSQLISERTKSCGCYSRERTSEVRTYRNRYDISGEYGIGYTRKGEVFYFDTEDFEKIKDYSWYICKHGYVCSSSKNTQKKIQLHRLVMECGDGRVIDHIKQNKHDNRKAELRVCTVSQNIMNNKPQKSSKSGYSGLHGIKDMKSGELR